MDELKYALLGIGTLAFFATVYLAVKEPKLVQNPAGQTAAETDADGSESILRRWDTVITWVMWGGWGLAGLLTFLDKAELLRFMES